MELGQAIRQARQEAGLSQKQLCGDRITRNMLSQIEHGAASPSVATLRYLAERLGVRVSALLGEEPTVRPEETALAEARACLARQDFAGTEAAADRLPPQDQEGWLLRLHARTGLAAQALDRGQPLYAAQLLQQAEEAAARTVYDGPALRRQRLLLLARTGTADCRTLAARLPAGEDESLLLRAEAALAAGDGAESGRILDAAADRESPRWNLLRGESFFSRQDYRPAAEAFRKAEAAYPRQAVPRLEICYRELGDFRLAYEYACKGR